MTWELAAEIAVLWMATSIVLGVFVGRYIRFANEAEEAFWRSVDDPLRLVDARTLPLMLGRNRVPALALTAVR